MKQINLIPWREQAREQRKREFFNIMAAALIASLLVVGFFHFILSTAISSQNDINNLYQQEINHLNQQLSIIEQLKKEQKAIVDRIGIIDKLQATRSQIATIFSDMVKTVPQGVYLANMKRVADEITINGKAESNARISTFMRSLEALSWVEQVSLSQIQTTAATNGFSNDFILEVKLKALQGVGDNMAAVAAQKGKPGQATQNQTKK